MRATGRDRRGAHHPGERRAAAARRRRGPLRRPAPRAQGRRAGAARAARRGRRPRRAARHAALPVALRAREALLAAARRAIGIDRALRASHSTSSARSTRCFDAVGRGHATRPPGSAGRLARRDAQRSRRGDPEPRLDRMLRDADTASAPLGPLFHRSQRPLRASGARRGAGGVRGIVHDASGSGTTLYIEPEALVELNNRHKQAEIDVEREVRACCATSRSGAARGWRTPLESGARGAGVHRPRLRPRIPGRLQMRATARGGRRGPDPAPAAPLRHSRHRCRWRRRAQRPAPRRELPRAGRLRPQRRRQDRRDEGVALAALFVRAGMHVPAGDGARAWTSSTRSWRTSATSSRSARTSRPSPRTWPTSREHRRSRRHRARWSCSTKSAPAPTPARARPSPRRLLESHWPTPERVS